MKELRGALIALSVLLLVGLAYVFTAPSIEQPQSVPSGEEKPSFLFRFEKQDLIKVDIDRPNSERIVLVEKTPNWIIEGTNFVASKTMVNRLKHQLHDLTPRAIVRKDESDLELYGLGKNAIQVTLHFRDGSTTTFSAGDPNPTGVSYYIQTPNKTVYVVKKSALDYLSHDFDLFREPKFLSFFSREVTNLNVNYIAKSLRWSFTREGEKQWTLTHPQTFDVDNDVIRTIIGRISALKAVRFIDPDEREGKYGLDDPTLKVDIALLDGRSISLKMGDSTKIKQSSVGYFQIDGDETIYLCSDALLEEFSSDISTLRNRKVFGVDWNDIETIEATILRSEEQRITGQSLVKFVSGQWVWQDGVPVPGSTPRRLAQAIGGISVVEFVDDMNAISDPLATVMVTTNSGQTRSITIGGFGKSMISSEGNEYKRRYIQIDSNPQIYLIDEHLTRVLYDLIREQTRKKTADADKAKRQKKIKEATER